MRHLVVGLVFGAIAGLAAGFSGLGILGGLATYSLSGMAATLVSAGLQAMRPDPGAMAVPARVIAR